MPLWLSVRWCRSHSGCHLHTHLAFLLDGPASFPPTLLDILCMHACTAYARDQSPHPLSHTSTISCSQIAGLFLGHQDSGQICRTVLDSWHVCSRGSTEVHVIFDNPERTNNTLEQSQCDSISTVSPDHTCEPLLSTTTTLKLEGELHQLYEMQEATTVEPRLPDTPEMWPSTKMRPLRSVRNAVSIDLYIIIRIPEMRTPCYSIKLTLGLAPAVSLPIQTHPYSRHFGEKICRFAC